VDYQASLVTNLAYRDGERIKFLDLTDEVDATKTVVDGQPRNPLRCFELAQRLTALGF